MWFFIAVTVVVVTFLLMAILVGPGNRGSQDDFILFSSTSDASSGCHSAHDAGCGE